MYGYLSKEEPWLIHTECWDGKTNSYKLRHMGKAKLRREGTIPISLECDPLPIARGRELLDESDPQ